MNDGPQEIAQIKKYFKSLANVPDEELNHLDQILKIHHLKKGDYYCRQAEFFTNIGFVVKGLMYSFYESAAGDIGVKRFLTVGDPVAAYPEVVFNLPASYSSKALEDSCIVHMDYKDFVKLSERHPCWDRIVRKSLEVEVLQREKREYSLFMLSAAERYEHFLKSNSALAQKVPQYLIASALGMTPEALSRIRSKK